MKTIRTRLDSRVLQDIPGTADASEIWHAAVRQHEWRAVRAAISELGFDLAGRRVLELGAGDGAQASLTAGVGAELTATDVDRQKVEALRARLADAKNVRVGVADMENLGEFGAGAYDIVMCSNVLEHCKRQNEGLRQVARVLKPNGIAFVSVPNRTWKLFNALVSVLVSVRTRPPREWARSIPIHGEYDTNPQEFLAFGLARWKQLFQRAGFRVEYVLFFPFYYGHGTRVLPLLRLGNRLGLSASFGFLLRKPRCQEEGRRESHGPRVRAARDERLTVAIGSRTA